MANQNQVWTLGINVGGAVQGIGQLVQAIGLQKSALNDMTISMVKYNSVQKNFEATIKGTTDKGDNVTARARIDSQTGNLKKVLGYQITPQKPDDALDDEGGINFNRLAQVTLFRTAIHAMINEIRTGTEEAIKFQTEISQIRIAAVNTNESFQQWGVTIRKVSDEFGQGQTDIAQAAIKALGTQLVQTRGQTENFVGVAAQFAQITGGTATQSVEVLSSAIRAFGKDIGDAQDVAGKLQLTMQLTGATSDQLANVFGKSGVLANSLGITFEELDATLVTLTQRGVAFGEANTFITELLTKMAKPSKELKQVFAEWGVATGQAAFQTFGFKGTIDKLSEAAKGAIPELAELFDSVHGLKGATGITLFKDFGDNVDKIKNSAEDYKKAAQTIIESPGKQIQLEINKIKNFFVDDLGSSTIGIIKHVTDEFGGLANMVIHVSNVLTPLTIIWASYKGVLVAVNVATTALSSASAGMAASIAAIGPYIAVAAAAFAAYKLIMQDTGNEALRTSANLQRIIDEGKKAGKVKFLDQTQLTGYKEEVQTVFQSVDRILANSFKEADSRLRSMREITKELGGDLESNFKSAIDKISEGIRELHRQITEAQSEIKKSAKSTVDFQKSLEDEIRQTQNKYATPQQKIGFNTQYIRELEDEIRKAYASGDKDEVESARKKFDEIKKLYAENFNTSVEIAKQSGGQIAVNVSSLKYAYQDLLTFRKQEEASYQAYLARSIKSLEDLTTKEQQRVKQMENAVKSFNELQNAITEGKLDKTDPKFKQFFGQNGEVDTAKLKAELQRRASLAIAYGGQAAAELIKINQGVDTQLLASAKAAQEQIVSLRKNTETQITNLIQVETAERIKFQIEETRKANDAAKEQATAAATALEAARNKLATGLGENVNNAKATLADLKAAAQSAKDAFSGIGALNLRISPVQRKEINSAVNEITKDIDDLQKKLTDLQNSNVKSPEAVRELGSKSEAAQQKVLLLVEALNKLRRAQEGDKNANIYNTIVPGANGQQTTLAAVIKDLQKQLSIVQQLSAETNKAEANFDRVKDVPAQIISGSTGALREQLLLSLTAGTTAEQALTTNFQGIGNSIDEVTRKINGFNDAIGGLRLKGILLKVDSGEANIPGNAGGGDAGHFATGGYLYGPRGGDNIPAWLTKGEFVMNSAATGMYRPILEAMNQSKRPGYYASGGYVTTNVGDININMTSTGRAETDVRRIGNLLRREIKRGNVTLR